MRNLPPISTPDPDDFHRRSCAHPQSRKKSDFSGFKVKCVIVDGGGKVHSFSPSASEHVTVHWRCVDHLCSLLAVSVKTGLDRFGHLY